MFAHKKCFIIFYYQLYLNESSTSISQKPAASIFNNPMLHLIHQIMHHKLLIMVSKSKWYLLSPPKNRRYYQSSLGPPWIACSLNLSPKSPVLCTPWWSFILSICSSCLTNLAFCTARLLTAKYKKTAFKYGRWWEFSYCGESKR